MVDTYTKFIESIQDRIKDIETSTTLVRIWDNNHIKGTKDIEVEVYEYITLDNGKLISLNYLTELKEIKEKDVENSTYAVGKCLTDNISDLTIELL